MRKPCHHFLSKIMPYNFFLPNQRSVCDLFPFGMTTEILMTAPVQLDASATLPWIVKLILQITQNLSLERSNQVCKIDKCLINMDC